jgi:repressor LexA
MTRAQSSDGTEASKKFYQQVGENIKNIRNTRGFSLQTLAERTNVTAKTIHRYERGEIKIDMNRATEVAKALNVDIYDLFKGADEFLLSGSESGKIDLLKIVQNENLPLFMDGKLVDEETRSKIIKLLSVLR